MAESITFFAACFSNTMRFMKAIDPEMSRIRMMFFGPVAPFIDHGRRRESYSTPHCASSLSSPQMKPG